MLTLALITLLGVALGYLFGSIPVGYLVGRAYGVDVRKHGSGRTGGSNVLRTVGWPAFALTIAGDALKGLIPVLLMSRVIAPDLHPAHAATVLAVLFGNNWSILIAWMAHGPATASQPAGLYESLKGLFARAKGGAGVITTAAAALAVYWPAVLPLVVVGLVMLVLFRYSSLASLTVAALYPLDMTFFVLIGSAPAAYLLMSLAAGALLIYVLFPNLRRLLAGKERKFGDRVELGA